MRVVIVGAGAMGRQVLQDLSEAGGHEIVVVESDASVADELADAFDALVLHGDGTDPGILGKARLDDADAIVATTGSDPMNTVVGLLAHRAGVERIVVRLASNSLRGALEEIGVTDVVNPTMEAAARVEAALHGANRQDIEDVFQGRLQLSELTVTDASDGRRISDLDIPDGALIVAHIRDSNGSVARPDISLEEGDVLVVVAETEKALESSRKRIEG